jgi:hypothetical protein
MTPVCQHNLSQELSNGLQGNFVLEIYTMRYTLIIYLFVVYLMTLFQNYNYATSNEKEL